MRHTLYPPDAVADVPEEEMAALRRGGFQMTATGETESALAQTAAEYAVLREKVMPNLPASLHPVAVYRWFTSRTPELVSEGLEEPLSPLAWLLAGYPPEVPARLAADLDNL
jgi:hypothetical protein